MSRMTVTKLQVDVLVQAAVYGPLEATNWKAMVDDPDELGRQLFSSGRRASGERNGEDYTFEPLPIAVTAAEIIKACSYYGYQRAKVPAIVDRLARNMQTHVPGYDDAPWAWGDDDIAARLDRPSPGSQQPAPLPVEVQEVVARLEAAGFRVVDALPTVPEDHDRWGGGRAFHGNVFATFGNTGPNGVSVMIAKSAEIAAKVFPHEVGRVEWTSVDRTDVLRIDNLLVTADLRRHSNYSEELVEVLKTLGTPDEAWSLTDPPLMKGVGQLVDSHVNMDLLGATVARTPSELAALIDTVQDPDCRERLRDVDLKHHSVLALPNFQLTDVAQVSVHRGVAQYREPKATFVDELFIAVTEEERPRLRSGSVVLIPRLQRRAHALRVKNPRSINEGRLGPTGYQYLDRARPRTSDS